MIMMGRGINTVSCALNSKSVKHESDLNCSWGNLTADIVRQMNDLSNIIDMNYFREMLGQLRWNVAEFWILDKKCDSMD